MKKGMKKGMKLLTLLMAGVLVTENAAGCGKNRGNGGSGQGETDIQISYWNAGLGSDWLDAVIEGFSKKHPEYNVYYNATAASNAANAAFGLEDTDTVDLYLAVKTFDTQYLEPLNDVLDTTIEGESKSIREKFDAAYLAMEEKDGNYYNLTHGGGILSFVYNKEIFTEMGISQLPRTTDEFAVVCEDLVDNGVKPLCHFKTVGYYEWLQEVWFAQYEGIDYYRDFYANPDKDKFTKEDGRYEAVKVYEKIITPQTVLQGSNSESHVSIQTRFLEGECAMMYNGSWLSNEMQNSEKIGKFEMMKTPVISSIVDKLTTVKSDPELRQLITAIDNVTDGVETEEAYRDGADYKVNGKTVSAADWDYVKAARNMFAASYAGETAYIPNYSNAKEGAKEFLKYLYSDEGYQVYLSTLHLKMPLSLSDGEIDTSGWNSFEQNQADLFGKMEYGITKDIMNKNRLFTDGGADSFGDQVYVNLMCANSEKDRLNAKEAWTNIITYINDHYDAHWMKNIK